MRNINNWTKGREGTFKFGDLAESEPMTLKAISSAKNSKMLQYDKKFLPYLLKRIAENSQQEDKFLKENIEFAIFLLKYPDKELRNAAISTIKSFTSNGAQTYGESVILERVKKELTIYIKVKVEEKVEGSENKDEEKQKIRKLIEQKLESDNKGTIRRDIREALGFLSKGKKWSEKLILNVICDENNVLGIFDTLLDSISPKLEVAQEHESSSSSIGNRNSNSQESDSAEAVVPDDSHKRCFTGFSLSSLCSFKEPHIDNDQEEETSKASVTDGDKGLDGDAKSQGDNRGTGRDQEEETSKASVTDGDKGLDGDAKSQGDNRSTGRDQEEETSKASGTDRNKGLDEGAQIQGDNRSTGSDQEEETSKASGTDEDKEAAGTTRAKARDYDDSAGVEEGGVKISSVRDRIKNYKRGLGENRAPSPPPSTSPTGTAFDQLKEEHGQALGL